MDYILSNLPEYEQAQTQLDNIAENWRKEVSAKMDEVDQLYKKFQAEQVLLTEPMKKQRIEEIEKKEKEVKDFQKGKFGPQGELFKKRQELVKPIQDKIYDEVQNFAKTKGYDFIFDKSNGTAMLFANERYDKSADILNAGKRKLNLFNTSNSKAACFLAYTLLKNLFLHPLKKL